MAINLKLQTGNLLIRSLTADDVPAVFRMSQENSLRQFLPDQVYETEKAASDVVDMLMANYARAEVSLAGTVCVLGVCLNDTSELIGHVGLSPLDDQMEIGYAISEQHQGNGYATQAVKSMTQWAMNSGGLSNIVAIVDSINVPSCRVLENAGYELLEEKIRKAFGREGLCRKYEIRK
jgi:ribosomal-protein-alanine N-acetyltransferase